MARTILYRGRQRIVSQDKGPVCPAVDPVKNPPSGGFPPTRTPLPAGVILLSSRRISAVTLRLLGTCAPLFFHTGPRLSVGMPIALGIAARRRMVSLTSGGARGRSTFGDVG